MPVLRSQTKKMREEEARSSIPVVNDKVRKRAAAEEEPEHQATRREKDARSTLSMVVDDVVKRSREENGNIQDQAKPLETQPKKNLRGEIGETAALAAESAVHDSKIEATNGETVRKENVQWKCGGVAGRTIIQRLRTGLNDPHEEKTVERNSPPPAMENANTEGPSTSADAVKRVEEKDDDVIFIEEVAPKSKNAVAGENQVARQQLFSDLNDEDLPSPILPIRNFAQRVQLKASQAPSTSTPKRLALPSTDVPIGKDVHPVQPSIPQQQEKKGSLEPPKNVQVGQPNLETRPLPSPESKNSLAKQVLTRQPLREKESSHPPLPSALSRGATGVYPPFIPTVPPPILSANLRPFLSFRPPWSYSTYPPLYSLNPVFSTTPLFSMRFPPTVPSNFIASGQNYPNACQQAPNAPLAFIPGSHGNGTTAMNRPVDFGPGPTTTSSLGPVSTANVDRGAQLNNAQQPKSVPKNGQLSSPFGRIEQLLPKNWLKTSKPTLMSNVVHWTKQHDDQKPEADDDQNIVTTDKYEKLRPVIIDGSNVAIAYGKTRFFDAKAILVAARYFIAAGHRVMAFVPKFRDDGRNHRYPTKNGHLLTWMYEHDLLTFTPCRDGDVRDDDAPQKQFSCYDDYFMVEYAHNTGGIIVSNDRFRDIGKTYPAWKDTIRNRVLMFAWIGEHFMPARDPLGKSGPSLEEFVLFGRGDEHFQNAHAGQHWTGEDVRKLLHRIDETLGNVRVDLNFPLKPVAKPVMDVEPGNCVDTKTPLPVSNEKKQPVGKKRNETNETKKPKKTKIWTCRFCPKEYLSELSLRRHVKRAHPAERKCSECGAAGFPSQKLLADHKKYSHQQPTTSEVAICNNLQQNRANAF